MRDKELYSKILGVETPWHVAHVELSITEGKVEIFLEHDGKKPSKCSVCDKPSPGYDRRQKKWRHLDTCQFQTILIADVPRTQCSDHGVKTIQVPWAEPNSGFTALFEALVEPSRYATKTSTAANVQYFLIPQQPVVAYSGSPFNEQYRTKTI